MNPSVKDRLASVVRALDGVVLPALPKEASLAQEQVMLAMSHIQIILAHLDATPAFLDEEAADLTAIGRAILSAAEGGGKTRAAIRALDATLTTTPDGNAEARTGRIQEAIDAVLVALANDGTRDARDAVRDLVLRHGAARAEKDRRWFAAMGFDIDYSGG